LLAGRKHIGSLNVDAPRVRNRRRIGDDHIDLAQTQHGPAIGDPQTEANMARSAYAASLQSGHLLDHFADDDALCVASIGLHAMNGAAVRIEERAVAANIE
jgi:hypothetical protein